MLPGRCAIWRFWFGTGYGDPVYFSLMRKVVVLLALVLAVSVYADDTSKRILASDEQTQITVPGNWEVLELNDAAEIEVGNETDEAYLIVLNELKDDLAGWNLDKHSRVTLGKLLSSLSDPTVTGPKSVTVNGSPAVQYEIRGASDGRNIVYIHTTVDGPKYFSQILAWTLASRVSVVKPQLMKAIATFREVAD
jgi:hypothetical protein